MTSLNCEQQQVSAKVIKNHQHQRNAFILHGTPYVRHKGYVRIHILISILQVNLWHQYIPYIIVLRSIYTVLSYIVRGTRWYQPVNPVTAVLW